MSGGAINGMAQPQQAQPMSGGLDSLSMLQAYRANPFSLATDMSRPAQFLPPALGNFDYSAQAAQQKAAADAAALAARQAGMGQSLDSFVGGGPAGPAGSGDSTGAGPGGDGGGGGGGGGGGK